MLVAVASRFDVGTHSFYEVSPRTSTTSFVKNLKTGTSSMSAFRFSIIISAPQMTHGEILDATDALAGAGCDDASIGGHDEGMELLFERTAESLQSALCSAVNDVEQAGYVVARIELQREAIAT
jgi:hypothetical protein